MADLVLVVGILALPVGPLLARRYNRHLEERIAYERAEIAAGRPLYREGPPRTWPRNAEQAARLAQTRECSR